MVITNPEVRSAVSIPPGNEWSLNELNIGLQPIYYNTRITAPVGRLRDLVDVLLSRYMAEGWQFQEAIALVDIGKVHHPTVVFTHPDRQTTLPECPEADFFKPAVLLPEKFVPHNYFPVDTAPLEPVLEGTNLYADYAYASYNEMEITTPETRRLARILGIRWVTRRYFQSGVAYVEIGLDDYDWVIHRFEERIQNLEKRVGLEYLYMKREHVPGHIHALMAQRNSLLTRKVINPERLFPA